MTHFRFSIAWRVTLIFLCLLSTSEVVQTAPPGKVDVLIGFKTPPGQNDIALLRAQGGKINHSYNLVPAVAATVPQQALIALGNNPNVSVIELDAEADLEAFEGLEPSPLVPVPHLDTATDANEALGRGLDFHARRLDEKHERTGAAVHDRHFRRTQVNIGVVDAEPGQGRKQVLDGGYPHLPVDESRGEPRITDILGTGQHLDGAL